MSPTPDDRITTIAALEARVGTPGEGALRKVTDHVHPNYAALIAASPFCVVATHGPDGLDVSPRGDAPGFVVVEDAKTLLLPERRGNHRIDSLRHLVADPRLALLFLIPGVGETLRVSGRASIRTAPALLARFAVDGNAPVCVLEIAVEKVMFQCARAILRSGLWAPPAADAAARVPSPGRILASLMDAGFDGAAYDAALPARLRSTLY